MRMVKDFVDVANHASLDSLIETLVSLRGSLPEGAEAEMRIRGDDVFGRTLSISFLRPQTEAGRIKVVAVMGRERAPSLPALFLLAGWAFAQLPRARQLYAAILIVPLFVSAIIGQYLWTPDQKSAEDQQVLDELRAQWQPGDLVIHSNEGYLVEWHLRGADLPQVMLPRTCPLGNLGGIAQATREALGMVDADPDTLNWRRAWFVYLVFPTITQCDANMADAFLATHAHRLAFAIQGDEFVEANIWLVTR